jgi:cytochrome c biogenesis protein CcmG, thiol:disulfide interchange protein DsbE
MQRLKLFLPLIIFVLLALVFLGVELRVKSGDYSPTAMPSALVDKPLPDFDLPTLNGERAGPGDMPAQAYLVNVWATWCPTCHYEHPFLVELQRRGIPIIGVDYKDSADAAQRWLQEKGDPYVMTLFDADGQFGLDLGVTGAPETYLVDSNGIVRFRFQGALDEKVWLKEFAPRVAALKGGAE